MCDAPLAERPVTALRGVGPALAELLAKLGLHTVQDVLFHLPLRYEDRTRVVPIGTPMPPELAAKVERFGRLPDDVARAKGGPA